MTTTRLSLLTSLSLFSLAAAATPAIAQEQPGSASQSAGANEVDQPSVEAGNEIIVTGTRRANRTVADSPVPVDVITSEQLSQTGSTDVARALREQVPSFNFPQPSVTDGTDVIRPATLRGLGPDQTLVLVNGKRRHTSALLNINGSVGRGTSAVDINMIPTIAIGRVEVLRDGAAAQYGSDAIAGVINFQLRSAREGGRITVTYGQYETRIDDVQDYSGMTLGANGQPTVAPDGTFNLNYTGKRKRSDGQTLTFAGTLGIPLFAEGFLNISGEVQNREATNRTGADPRRQFALVGGGVDPRELTFNRFSHRFGDPETFDGKLFVNAGVPLGGAELYAFGSYGDRDGESAGFYRIASDARNTLAIYPEGFLPLIRTEQDDIAGTAGVRGEAAGFRYDLSTTYGRNIVDFEIANTLNRSLGPTSPTRFDSGGLRYAQMIVNLDVSRDLALGFAESVTLAGGLEYRRESFDIRPGEPDSFRNGTFGGPPGAQVFAGFQSTIGGQRVDDKKNRNNKSAYLEIDADVTSAFTVQFAGRYEDYSDFGSDFNGKAAARFEPFQGFAIRGAVSTGFRAPSLQQQFFASQATNNVAGVLLDAVTLPVDNPVAIALGAIPLKAETSLSYSAGVVFNAVPRLNVTVDVYQIDIDDRIVVTDNLAATRNAAGEPIGTPVGAGIARILNAAGFPTTNTARFFINGVDTRTRGLDAVGTYRLPLGSAGTLGLVAGFNYNKTTIREVLAAPGPLATVPGIVLFGRQESLRLAQGQPRTKINIGADYDFRAFGATVRANRYGKVLGAGADRFGDLEIGAEWVLDAEVRLTLADRFDFAVGANNLLDAYPDPIQRGRGTDPDTGLGRNFPATNYALPYSAFSPFGFNGRFLYGRATMRF
ncbi:MAG TPA: TonB-dependent receptor [Sphingomonadaceae bacterium]|nr:TonB-dependent receptor [Sphingomonadaceae bacterium]